MEYKNCDVLFEPITHTYSDKYGNCYISVTQFLEKAIELGLIKGGYATSIPQEVLDRACAFGTAVHESLENYIKKGFAIFYDDPMLDSCINNGISQIGRMKKIDKAEYLVANVKYKIAGTIDIVFEDNELGDWKTNVSISDDILNKYIWQLSFYQWMYGVPKEKGIIIQLGKGKIDKKTGTFTEGKLKVYNIKLHSFEEVVALIKKVQELDTKI